MDKHSERLWKALTDVDDYLARGLLEQIDGAPSFAGSDMVRIHETYKAFREESPWLREEVTEATEHAFSGLENNLNEFLAVPRAYADAAPPDQEAPKTRALEQLELTLREYREALSLKQEFSCRPFTLGVEGVDVSATGICLLPYGT